MSDEGQQIESKVKEISSKVGIAMRSRAYRAANELRNASQLVLRGQRSGRQYIVPGTGRMRYYKRDSKDGTHKAGTATISYRRYTASAPGEPPAVRTGAFRSGWQTKPTQSLENAGILTIRAGIENRVRTDNGAHLLGEVLENGTGRMAPRPYREKIQEKAKKNIIKIYKEPYT